MNRDMISIHNNWLDPTLLLLNKYNYKQQSVV